MTKYNLYGYENNNSLYINGMSLEGYLWYLNNKRHFNQELIIEHTKKYYDIDLTGIIGGYFYDFKDNIYETFRNNNSNNKEDDGTRKYFDSHGRRYYEKFMNQSCFFEEDCLTHHQMYTDIHHIYPLVYGGKNNLENLIHLSKFNHDLLHENPFEKNEEDCYRALDYLGYLYSVGKTYDLFHEYNLGRYSDKTVHDAFKSVIKEEMMKFYKKR
ncbi:hypothetical protein [Metabacillus sp. Hm71]|uniref:hypothetical protein n=1 Tax=Metabacillus sp. Hm71 TaxID=3450743 RepID=UPI003F44203D